MSEERELERLLYTLFRTMGKSKEMVNIWEESSSEYERLIECGEENQILKEAASTASNLFKDYKLSMDGVLEFFPPYMRPVIKEGMKMDSGYVIDMLSSCAKEYGRGMVFEEFLKHMAKDLVKNLIIGDMKKMFKPFYGDRN